MLYLAIHYLLNKYLPFSWSYKLTTIRCWVYSTPPLYIITRLSIATCLLLSLGKGGQEAMAGNEYATIPVNQAQPLPAKEPLGDTNA